MEEKIIRSTPQHLNCGVAVDRQRAGIDGQSICVKPGTQLKWSRIKETSSCEAKYPHRNSLN